MKIKKIQIGVSLVELMIAIALGLFIVSGLLYLYLGSKSNYSTQAAVARVQEALRFSFEYLAFDLRMAGYSGCANVRDATPQVVANAPVPQFGLGGSLRGYDNGTGWTKPAGWPARVLGTDVVTISSVSTDCGSNVVSPFSNGSQLFIASNNCAFADNEVLIVTDCRRADVFRGQISNGTGKINVAHGSSNNTQPTGSTCPGGSGKLVTECGPAGNYGSDAFLARVSGYTFYIGVNGRGNPALYRGRYNDTTAAGAEELVEGIYDMQIEYGLDTVDDTVYVANQYLPASSINAPSAAPHWGQVVSAKITLRARSESDNLVPVSQTYTYNSNTANNITDRRYQQTFTTAIGLRNLVQ